MSDGNPTIDPKVPLTHDEVLVQQGKMQERPNYAYGLGEKFKDWTDSSRRMGAWTGLPAPFAAPASGALWGAGAGLLYHGIKNKLVPFIKGERPNPKSNMARNTIAGALLGLGLGGAAEYGHYKKQSYYDPNQDLGRLITVILRDPNMSHYQKQQALARLDQLSIDEVKRLTASAAIGGLTGAALGTLLGIGPLAGGLAGASFGSFLGSNNFTF